MEKKSIHSLPLFLWVLAFSLSIVLTAAAPFPVSPSQLWQSKVDEDLLAQALSSPSQEADFLVFMREQADLTPAASLAVKADKGAFVFSALRQTALRTQPPLLAELEKLGAAYRPFWVANMVWVRGDLNVLESTARQPGVAHIYANPSLRLSAPEQTAAPQSVQTPEAVEWNIALVNAPNVWEAGFTGQGVIIGGQDTGYLWDHPALLQQYRGSSSSGVSHDYNWHDAIRQPLRSSITNNPCGYDSPVPCDDNNHGTHTMGTTLGNDQMGNQIGMAPDAQWIGCRNMDLGWGTPATYTECFEWFIAPYPYGGGSANGNPALAPHIINNSWGCPPSEGCTVPDILKTVVENVRAAGIFVVASAGNSGPQCSTVSTPIAIYERVFSVGATDSSDRIAGFSSRGPVAVDGSRRVKPDVTAPGVGIRSSLASGGYSSQTWSGTSMASPHVAGLAALLISANPELAGQVDQLEDLIRRSALPLAASQSCGEEDHSSAPNNTYGWGRIDAWRAFQLLPSLDLSKSASATTVAPGEPITYTLTLRHHVPSFLPTGVVITDRLPSGTSFVSASGPFRLEGDTVVWEYAELAAGQHPQVELVVTTPLTITEGVVSNHDYFAFSDQVSQHVSGPPVNVFVGYHADLSFSPGVETAVYPGTEIILSHTLTNPGNLTGTAAFSVDLTQEWPVSEIPHIALAPGESRDVVLSVTAPASETFYREVYLVLTATLLEDENVSAQVVNKLVVIPRQVFLPNLLRLAR